jgi:general secretion pathway protein I
MKQRGFTLMEVLIALLILSLAIAAVIKTVNSSAANAAYLRDRTLAHWVGMNTLAEQKLAPTWPNVGTQKGKSLMAGQTWYWQLTVNNTPDRNIRHLEILVRLDKENEDPITTLSAYVGRPTH